MSDQLDARQMPPTDAEAGLPGGAGLVGGGPACRSISRVPAVLFMASMASLVAAFVVIKLFLLALFLATAVLNLALGRTRLVVPPRLVTFYLLLGVAGVVWVLVGLFHPGNFVPGVLDAVRLYVIWSLAFIVLHSLLRSEPSLGLMHGAMVAAGLVISVMNFLGLADELGGWGLISAGVREQLDMNIGIHEGYVQITTQNIGALFLVVPYLLSLQFRSDAGKVNSAPTRLSLAMSLVLAVLSGRRALWLVVGMTPGLVLFLSLLTGSYGLVKPWGRGLLKAYAVATAVVLGLVLVLPEVIPEQGSLAHLREAFSSEDERTIQKPFLIDGFKESPVLGSGFGAAAGYLRDYERPWAGYELTYYQLLFNLGLVGVAALGALFAVYFGLVVSLMRRFKEGSAIPLGLLVAICALLIGAYSNRYFGSFDLLFFLGVLPYLSTFRSGFVTPAPVAGAGA